MEAGAHVSRNTQTLVASSTPAQWHKSRTATIGGNVLETNDTEAPRCIGPFEVLIEYTPLYICDDIDDGRRTWHMREDEADQICAELLAQDRVIRQEIADYLESCERIDKHRQELHHKTWHDNHFYPNQRDLQKQFGEGSRYKRLRREKAAAVDKYLDIVDRRGHVFRDTYTASEYDPLAISHRQPPDLSLSARAWCGDVLRYLPDEARNTEDIRGGEDDVQPPGRSKVFLPQPQNRLIPLGRHGTTCDRWAEMHRKFVDSPENKLSQKRRLNKRNGSYGATISLQDPL